MLRSNRHVFLRFRQIDQFLRHFDERRAHPRIIILLTWIRLRPRPPCGLFFYVYGDDRLDIADSLSPSR